MLLIIYSYKVKYDWFFYKEKNQLERPRVYC